MYGATSTVEIDPLLRDLSEKKQSFRRNIVSLAAELKDVRSRLSSQEESFAKESLTRQEAEARAKHMEAEITRLQKSLDERNLQLQASSSDAAKYLRELDDFTSQLSSTKATAEASAALAQSAQLQCKALLKELDEKTKSLKEHEARVNKLADQLGLLQKDLQSSESSQRQLKDEVIRVELYIMQALAKYGANNNSELGKILDEVLPRNLDKMNKLLSDKDEEIAKLRDEIRVMSAHWKLKTKDLESQLEKHHRADQDVKKRVLKLEFFCLHKARTQTRKLERMWERRDKALKELRDELSSSKNVTSGTSRIYIRNHNFQESLEFKIAVSLSKLIWRCFPSASKFKNLNVEKIVEKIFTNFDINNNM